MKYNTIEEITKSFIKQGWNNPTFTMLSAIEVKEKYGISDLKAGNYFVMNETGNVFSNTGKILLYNIHPVKNPKCYWGGRQCIKR